MSPRANALPPAWALCHLMSPWLLHLLGNVKTRVQALDIWKKRGVKRPHLETGLAPPPRPVSVSTSTRWKATPYRGALVLLQPWGLPGGQAMPSLSFAQAEEDRPYSLRRTLCPAGLTSFQTL